MTAPYQAICACGRTVVRQSPLEIPPIRCSSCLAEASRAHYQLELFALPPSPGVGPADEHARGEKGMA